MNLLLSSPNAPFEKVPEDWNESCANSECTFHQLSPYIGKLKSRIAGELIERYSKPNDLIVDPFSGAGTIPFEATSRGRRAFASDISEYSELLTTAKLQAPRTLRAALLKSENYLSEAESLPLPTLDSVPPWVKAFFHPKTLAEALRFAQLLRAKENPFVTACFLGILHHQRPGFLSYPSSNLVPYLRNQKFPKRDFPQLYTYRDLRSRLISKIERTYKRPPLTPLSKGTFVRSAVSEVGFPETFDALITSPPYMNALDYTRDNRLRLWFLNPSQEINPENPATKRKAAFRACIVELAKRVQSSLRSKGYSILVVGEECKRSFHSHPADEVRDVISEHAPSLQLEKILSDDIPDIRRTRRKCRGIKTEHFLIFRKK
jgi:hypothetical protein